MQNKQAREIIDVLLREKGKRWKPDQIDAFLKPFEIDGKAMIKVLEHLVDDYIFKWFEFICLKLPQLATEEEFISLLRKIIRRVKRDLAQGPFIRTLIDIGEGDPHLGISLYKQMMATKDEDLVSYSSFPLGGAGKRRFSEAYSLVNEALRSKDAHLKQAAIKTLRVAFGDKPELERESEIFDVLAGLSSGEEEAIVQNEVLDAYVDFTRFRPDECSRHLIAFSKRGGSQIRFHLAHILWLKDLPNKEDEIKILMICAEDEDANVLSQVALALSRKGQEFPEKSLEIIKDWIQRGKYSSVHEIEYPIREIGKVHLDRCIKEVEKWIKEDDARLKFFIPIVLKELSSSDYTRLVDHVKSWPSRNERFRKMTIKTIRAALTEIYPAGAYQRSLIDLCFSILEEMATEKKSQRREDNPWRT